MNSLSNTLARVFAIGCFVSASSAPAIDILTDSTVFNQKFEAWGTSLAWMGNELGRSTSGSRRDQIMDLLFDQTNGLGLNFVRYNIGAGQNPAGPAITRPGAAMDGWVPNAPSSVSDTSSWQWNWNADVTQRLILNEALERGVTQVEAFANSAPWWMTVAQSSRGNPNTGQTNLDLGNYEVFGHYLLEVTEHFESTLGIHFHSLAPMNEPGATWWDGGNNQEGMYIPVGGAQSALVREIGEQIVTRGLETGLVGPEETAIRWTLNSYDNWGSITRSFISQINTHSYPWGGGSDAADAAALVNYNNTRPEGPKKIYATEFGTGGNSTPVSGGITLANQITSDINNLGAAGWTYWQAVEDNNGSNWGLLIAPFNGTNTWFNMRRQYYAMQQFSAFIRPGAQILDQAHDETVAAYDLRTDSTTLVVTNDESTTDVNQYALLDRTAAFTRLVRTSDTENFQALGPVQPVGNVLTVSSLGNTISTLVIHHRPNLIQNANFSLEGAPLGSPSIPGWQSEGGLFYANQDNTLDGSGAGALWTNNPTNSGQTYQTGIGDASTDLTGIAYQFSLDVMFQNEGSDFYDADTHLAIEFYGADDQTLTHGSPSEYQTLILPALGIDESRGTDSVFRTYRSQRFVAPPGTRYVRPVIRYGNVDSDSTSWVYFDNAYLQAVHPLASAREWNVKGDGDWGQAKNWMNHAQVEKNSRQYFGDVIRQDSTVTLNTTETITEITFFSEFKYHVQGTGEILIGDAGAPALIDTRMGNHRISVEAELMGDATFQVLPGARLTLDGGLDLNGKALTQLGAGDLDLTTGLVMKGGTIQAYATSDASLHLGPDAVLDGDFSLLLAPGQTLQIGDVFEIASYDVLNDTFNNIFLPDLTTDLVWYVNYGINALTIQVGVALEGDYNNDKIVDARDYALWRESLGQPDGTLINDGSLSGIVGQDHFNLWLANFGARTALSTPAATPEPAGFTLLALMIAAWGARLRTRS